MYHRLTRASYSQYALYYDNDSLYINRNNNKNIGHSVRCIRSS